MTNRFGMPATTDTIAADDVARLLGRSRAWFYRKRKDLHAAGFPHPLPVVGRWSRQAVRTWLDSAAGVAAIAADPEHASETARAVGEFAGDVAAQAGVEDLEAWREILGRRSQELGQ